MPSPAPTRPRGGPRLISEEREDDLRVRLAARDEGALSELVDLLSPWLLGITQSMLRDADDAEEIVLETFRIVWEKVPPPEVGPRGLIPWVLHIARNRSIDRLRSRARRRSLGERWLAGQEVNVVPVEPAEAALPGWHVHTAVHQALGQLPEDQRQAVQLAYFEGQTQSEVATALGIPLGTVKTRLRLAFGKLRTSLEQISDWVI
jgi:RNA polymerase sigma-70 factor (ECF subfamily)